MLKLTFLGLILGLGFSAQAMEQQLTVKQQQLKNLVVASGRSGVGIRAAQPELRAALVAQRADINAQIRALRAQVSVAESTVAYRVAHEVLRDVYGQGSLQ
jgi:hypothetical protein